MQFRHKYAEILLKILANLGRRSRAHPQDGIHHDGRIAAKQWQNGRGHTPADRAVRKP